MRRGRMLTGRGGCRRGRAGPKWHVAACRRFSSQGGDRLKINIYIVENSIDSKVNPSRVSCYIKFFFY